VFRLLLANQVVRRVKGKHFVHGKRMRGAEQAAQLIVAVTGLAFAGVADGGELPRGIVLVTAGNLLALAVWLADQGLLLALLLLFRAASQQTPHRIPLIAAA